MANFQFFLVVTLAVYDSQDLTVYGLDVNLSVLFGCYGMEIIEYKGRKYLCREYLSVLFGCYEDIEVIEE